MAATLSTMSTDEMDMDDLEVARYNNNNSNYTTAANLYPWMMQASPSYYADEASLYSIPENSRGEAASEFNSRPPSVAGSDAQWDREQPSVTVEWGHHGLLPTTAEALNNTNYSNSDKPQSLSLSSTHDEGSSGDDENELAAAAAMGRRSKTRSRKLYGIGCVALFVLLAVVLGVTLSNNNNTNNNQQESKQISSSVHSDDLSEPTADPEDETMGVVTKQPVAVDDRTTTDEPIIGATNAPQVPIEQDVDDTMVTTAVPTASPSLADTPSPPDNTSGNIISSTLAPTRATIPDYASMLVRKYILQALSSCTDSTEVSTAGTIQNNVFEALYGTIFSNITANYEGDAFEIPIDYGMDMIAERFGIMMLHETTGGDYWNRKDNWFSPSDVCLPWYGVDKCNTRSKGSCAVLSLQLGTYSAS